MTSPYSFDVTEAEFIQQVVEASRHQPVLVDFWATWCQPCQILKPLLEKLSDDYQGKFLLAKVNTEEAQQLAMQFGIRSIPMVKLFKNGEVVDEFTGALPEPQIRAFLDRHIPRESDTLLDQAEDLLALGKTDEAMALVKQANQTDPENSRALVAYARISATLGNIDEAKAVIDALPAEAKESPEVSALLAQMEFDSIARSGDSTDKLEARLKENPGDSEARYQLAAQLVMQGETEAALENLLTLIKLDRSYNDDAARKMIFKIFDSLGNHPLVATYRRKLMSLIY
jgi:putative thioredoxin